LPKLSLKITKRLADENGKEKKLGTDTGADRKEIRTSENSSIHHLKQLSAFFTFMNQPFASLPIFFAPPPLLKKGRSPEHTNTVTRKTRKETQGLKAQEQDQGHAHMEQKKVLEGRKEGKR